MNAVSKEKYWLDYVCGAFEGMSKQYTAGSDFFLTDLFFFFPLLLTRQNWSPH